MEKAIPEEAVGQGPQPVLQGRGHFSEVVVLVANDSQQVPQATGVVLPVLA